MTKGFEAEGPLNKAPLGGRESASSSKSSKSSGTFLALRSRSGLERAKSFDTSAGFSCFLPGGAPKTGIGIEFWISLTEGLASCFVGDSVIVGSLNPPDRGSSATGAGLGFSLLLAGNMKGFSSFFSFCTSFLGAGSVLNKKGFSTVVFPSFFFARSEFSNKSAVSLSSSSMNLNKPSARVFLGSFLICLDLSSSGRSKSPEKFFLSFAGGLLDGRNKVSISSSSVMFGRN